MKAFTWLSGALLLAVLVTGCTSPEPALPPPARPTGAAAPARAEWQVKWDNITAGAKKEGQLRLYAGFGGDARAIVQKIFKEKYGIETEFVVGRGAELTNKLRSERQAGLFLADMVISGATNMFTIRDYDILEPVGNSLVLPEVLDPAAWKGGKLPIVDGKGSVLVFIGSNQRFIGINTDLVKAGEIKTAMDILAPKWKGKVSLNDPSLSGSANSYFAFLAGNVLGEEKTKQLLVDLLRQQQAVVTKDTRQQAEWLAHGKHALALGIDPEDVVTFIKAGAPVTTIKLAEGSLLGHTGGGVLGVPTRPPHPNAALLFVNWLLSKEGQTIFAQAVGNPSMRVDISSEGIPPTKFADADEKVVVRDEEMYLYSNKMTPVWKQIVDAHMQSGK